MAFTQVTCTGTVILGTGKPAANVLVRAFPNVPMTNGGVTVSDPFSALTDSSGHFSFVLPANDDVGTTPANTYYNVRVHVAGTGGGSDIYQRFSTVVSQASAPTLNLLSATRLSATPGALYPDATYAGLFPEGWSSVISRSRSYTRGTFGFVNFSGSSSQFNYLTNLSALMTTYVFTAVKAATKIRIAYGAWAYGTDVGTTVPIGQVTIEYPHASGQFFDATFGGTQTITLNSGQVVMSDEIDLSSVGGMAAGTTFNVRTWVPCNTGQNIPTFDDQITTGAADKISANGTASNQCHTAYASVTSTNGGGFGPCGIFGNNGGPSIALIGDSITQGVGDSVFPSVGVHAGWADRAFNNQWGLVSLARHAERGDQWLSGISQSQTTTTTKHRHGLAYSCNRVICAYGNNDLYTVPNLTADQLMNVLVELWRDFRSVGTRVWATTITPRTTTTDAWATSANQTPVANGAARISVNQWLRDGAPIDINSQPVSVGGTGFRAGDNRHPLVANGIIDIATAIETAQDSGVWKNVAVNGTGPWTNDGIHPQALGHVAMAALITPSVFA